MIKTLCILTLALFVMSTAGAAATTTSTSGKIVVVTHLSQINNALQNEPVF